MGDSSYEVLYFGKKDCRFSRSLSDFIRFLGFRLTLVESEHRGERLPEEALWWNGDFIFCFRSYFILPTALLSRAKHAAINFHPAPPEYPGSGCLNWALYDGAKQYGATAHIMTKDVDNGGIIDCRRFPILPQDNVDSLLQRAHGKTHDLALDTLTGIATQGPDYISVKLREMQNERWSGKARKMNEIDRLQKVDVACSQEQLERLIRATHTAAYPLYIELHGKRFHLE